MRVIQNILLVSVTCFILTLAASAQTPDPTPTPGKVLVDQEFIDDATRAFNEVVSLRKAVADGVATVEAKNKAIGELMQLLKEYALLDQKQKKGFWKKVVDKLVKLADMATEPATIRAVIELVILAKVASR